MRRLLVTVFSGLGLIAAAAFVGPTLAGQSAGRSVAAPDATRVKGVKAAWSPPRTPWGDPDIAGIFTTDDELGVPFERPEQFSGRDAVSAEEFTQRQEQARRLAEADAEEFVVPRAGAGPEGGGGTGPPSHWIERGKPSRRTSIVIDPSDGRIPYINEEARQRAGSAVNARTSGRRPFDGPEAMDLYDRCITRGFPHVIFPTIYDNTSQIVQGPGFVAIRYEMIHDARVIPLDGSSHIASGVRQWRGDSRGHWEGDTLVVETTNFTGKTAFRGSGEKMRLIERFKRMDAGTLLYQYTVDDPSSFEKPWTVGIPLPRSEAPMFEYAYHEGNYAMTGGLAGARAQEKSPD